MGGLGKRVVLVERQELLDDAQEYVSRIGMTRHERWKTRLLMHLGRIARIRTLHAILSGTMQMAIRYGWITVNPLGPVGEAACSSRNLSRRARRKPRGWSPPLSTRTTGGGALVWLVMVTGMRRSELAALLWRHIDLLRLCRGRRGRCSQGHQDTPDAPTHP